MTNFGAEIGSRSSRAKYDLKYCSLCDEYFYSKALLHQHMQGSSRHPRCETCKRSYLNMNSLRNHYVYSARHHYCRACDKSFQTASGLRVHMEYHADDSDDEGEGPEGWEDEVARQREEAERANQNEEPIPAEAIEADEKRLTKIQRRAALMNFITRRMRDKATASADQLKKQKLYSFTCPICLGRAKTASSTRCGHLFCAPCIERAVESSGMCPTCRKPAVVAQIRKLDLTVY
ncbi:putative zinc finger, C3HC4 type (RING finger) [Lyophyllum shimeji]|uniref:Zinc finger, C3HC4 type (RING finger) n=1 Tax=Lyophyllum shimeji TaxID=47721 RepID=A0A9P3PHM9_LYOSH|nr:putative zinc finger, C3HC4 type (RING finger) [Lyophyllum shimeji]